MASLVADSVTPRRLRRRAAMSMLALSFALLVSACGFQLRGSNGQYLLPFDAIYIGLPDTSPLAINLKRNIRSNGATRIAPDAKAADAIVEVLSNPEKTRGKTILSLNNNGRVREYQLSYNISFRVLDKLGNELLAPTNIALVRSITFDESQLLAKETEEALLYRDMQSDLVQQMIRRIAAIKPVITSSSMPLPGNRPDQKNPSSSPPSAVP